MTGRYIGERVTVDVDVSTSVDGAEVGDTVTLDVGSTTIEVGVLSVLVEVNVGVGNVSNDGVGVDVAPATWQAERARINSTTK
jgi:hypothetical protein